METKGSLQRELRLVCSLAWQLCMEDASFSNLPSSLCQHPSFSAFFFMSLSFFEPASPPVRAPLFFPLNASLSFSRLSLSLCAEKSLIVVLTPLTQCRQGKSRPTLKNTLLSEFLTSPSDRKSDLRGVFYFYRYI